MAVFSVMGLVTLSSIQCVVVWWVGGDDVEDGAFLLWGAGFFVEFRDVAFELSVVSVLL